MKTHDDVALLKEKLMAESFTEYDINEVMHRDATEYYPMTGEHTEILGQFMLRTGMMDVSHLKEVLVEGFCTMLKRKKEENK